MSNLYYISKISILTIIISSFLLETNATIRYVSHTGSSTPPYTTWETAADSIQKVINICNNGDTVIVANGVYRETLIVNKEICLIGSSMDSTVIDGSTSSYYNIIEFQKEGRIENFHIIGRGFESNTTCIASLQNNAYINNCKITNSPYGIFFGFSSGKANSIISRGIKESFHSECPNDTCHPSLTNSVIISSAEPWFNAVYFSYGGSAIIENNIIISEGNVLTGIEVDAFVNPIIKNNLVLGFDDQNFGTHNSTDSTLLINNVASYSQEAGIKLNNGAKANLRNNIVSNNNQGISVLNGVPNLDYNLFWENNTDLIGLIYGDSDIVADPMFVKDTIPNSNLNFDFHLQKYSPAIDAGDPSILDIDGSRSDLGAFGGPSGEKYTYHDLSPKPPANLTAVYQNNVINLKWNKNTETDFSHYRIYRDIVPNFIYDISKMIGETSDTIFTDILTEPNKAKNYYYKITAFDNQDNQSAASEEIHVIVTGLGEIPPQIIEEYKLLNNYPNPFNPTTTIPYRLKEAGYVKLMVYNILGELVRVLVNQWQDKGYYEVEFRPTKAEKKTTEGYVEFETGYYGDVASGFFIYRIEVIGEGNIPRFSDMRKMMLIK